MIYGKKRDVEQKEQNVNIHNKFDIEVRRVDTGEVTNYEAYNTVLDVGLKNVVGRPNNHALYILQFGEDTTEPNRAQTGLIKPFGTVEFSKAVGIATTTMVNSHTVAVRDRAYVSTSQFNGKLFAELGSHSYAGGIFNRALFQDINGNPIVIRKDDKMEITIYLTIYLDFKLLPHQSIMNIGWSAEFAKSLLFNSNTYGGSSLIPTGSYTNIYPGGMPTPLSGATSNTWNIPRIEPGSGNNNGGYLANICAGVIDYFPLMDTSKYALTDQPLGTGNGTLVNFGTGYPMKSIEIKKNGLIVPPSDYVFHPLGRRDGNTAYVQGTVCNCYLVETQYRQPICYSEMRSGETQFYVSWYLETGKWLEFAVPGEDRILNRVYPIVLNNVSGAYLYLMSSEDGLTWEDHGKIAATSVKDFATPRSRFKIKLDERTPGIIETLRFIFMNYSFVPQIQFNTPPATGDVLTYSGVPACIPKSDQYVIDGTATVDWTPSQV